MSLFKIKKLICIVMTGLLSVGFVACQSRKKVATSQIKNSGIPVGNLKGYQKINGIVKSRLVATSQSQYFDLAGTYLGSFGSEQFPSDLAILMGSFTNSEGGRSYVNGEPNTVNVTLWDSVLLSLSKDMSSHCDGQAPVAYYRFKDSIKTTLKSMCDGWPNSITEENLQALWFVVMSYDASDAAAKDWKISIMEGAPELSKLPPKEGVSALLRTIFMNPWFLLEI